MLKRLVLAIAIVVTSSFATWDLFPVLGASKGQAEAGYLYETKDKWSFLDSYVAVRYTFVENFELAANIPYVIFIHYDGESANLSGIMDISLSARYQFFPFMNAFLDAYFPTCSNDICTVDRAFGYHFGFQFSETLGVMKFGSELGYIIETEGSNHISPPSKLNLDLETDFVLGDTFIPYIGININMRVGKTTNHLTNNSEDHTGEMGYVPYIGTIFNISPIMYLGFQSKFTIGKKYFDYEKLPVILSLKFGVSFYSN